MNDQWGNLVIKSKKELQSSGTPPGEINLDDLTKELGISDKDIDKFGDFENFTPTDIAAAFLFGIGGAFTSWGLEDSLDKIHYKEYKKQDNPILYRIQDWLDHKGSPMDEIMGRKHRWKYGHDIFNPFEVWEKIVQSLGGGLNGHIKAGLHWIKHIVADSLSKDGLPLPGHSLFREFLVDNFRAETLKKYMTIKTRDLIGAGLVSALLSGYRVYNIKVKNATPHPNYRMYTTNILAHSTCLVCGVMLGSLNYGSLVLAGKNIVQASIYDLKVDKRIDNQYESLQRMISEPPQYGLEFEKLISSIDETEEITEEVGEPIVGKIIYFDQFNRR